MLSINSCGSTVGRFTVSNESSEQLARVSVTVCEQTIDIRDIQPGASVKAQYRVTSDSHFLIVVVFKSGKTLRREDGYVTNGVEYNHDIVVTNSDIKLRVLTIK